MRMIWLLGCVGMISTASAQPAPTPPPALPTEAAPAPPAATPLRPPALASAASGATAPAIVEPAYEYDSYGWQIALADVASTAIIFTHGTNTTATGLLAYALAGPVIHGAHGQGGRALVSAGLRVGLPVISALAWNAIAQSSTRCAPDDFDCGDTTGAALLGFGLGVLTAMVIDDSLLAGPVKAKQPARVTWVPEVAATPQRVTLGVLGRF